MKVYLTKTWKKIIVVIGLAVIVYVCFRFLLPLGLPFVLAGLVSAFYYPFLRKVWNRLFRCNMNKVFCVIAVGLFYAVVFALICLVLGYLCGQGKSIVLNLPFYQAKCMVLLKNCCCQFDDIFRMREGASYEYIAALAGDNWSESANTILLKVTGYSVHLAQRFFSLLLGVVITIIATFFMIQEYDNIRECLLASEIGKSVCCMVHKCKETLKAYVKAQGLIMLLNGAVCTAVFWFIGQPYFLILGCVVAVVDALPVLGAGLILIPYTLLLVLEKEFGCAAVLILAYIACVLIRQVTEPRMIGGKAGIKPLYTIAGMYIGFKLFGVFGFLLGPIGLLIVKEMYDSLDIV